MTATRKAPDGAPLLPLDSEVGPAPHITRAKADAIIQAAIARAARVQEAPVGSVSASSIPQAAPDADASRRRRRLRLGPMAAAAVVLCATLGSASAAVLIYARVVGPAPVTTTATPRGERVTSSRRAPAPLVRPATEPMALPSPAPEPVLTEPAPKSPRASEDFLTEGNRLRADKRWRQADAAYVRAYRSAPHSQAAYVAQVASAAVRLEHLGDPRAALRRYRAALRQRPDGPLTEEIHFGIAEAYRALGQRDRERAALALFLREHPSSPHAAEARSRLER